MKPLLSRLIINYKVVLILFSILAIFASVQSYLKPESINIGNGRYYTHYNNYIIFKQSFFHLIHYQDLYKLFWDEHWDLYKYSPTFSLFFGFFALLPDIAGIIIWNLLNAFVLFLGFRSLPQFNDKVKALMLFAMFMEVLTTLQNEQSNALTAGLVIWAVGLLERKNYLWATFCIVCSCYIKLFGLVAFALFLFYPNKIKLTAYTIFWFVVLFMLPLVVVDWQQLIFLYKSWLHLLQNDHSISLGFSVMGWLETWFGFNPSKVAVLFFGAGLFCLPFIRIKHYQDYVFRLLALASVLIWVVIFNHKAESPTFIIALSGVVIWFFSQEKTLTNKVLFTLAILFTELAASDLYPRFIRKTFFEPYVVKVVPCILIWCWIIYQMLFNYYKPKLEKVLDEYKALEVN
ncbi:glycosyltransferase family 87 protein [Adhaeribacter aquaticus]|uniref:glycosyltransferase family 87 protein n=1 Tax=Adhaeribacter aquaticus TaxID=299567 RepID=UPI0003F88B6E|nr:glycosyltransferase family 87 protein [Adhaeribacter aquaticus]